MSKIPSRWKLRATSQAVEVASRADQEEPVFLDVERLQQSIEAPKFVMPSGLSAEEKRQFILAVANGHR
jgi:hypothetical protein